MRVHEQVAQGVAAQQRQADAALLLRRLAHPGVVEVVDHDASAGRLVTRWAGVPVSELDALTGTEIAGVGAAAATILGDLHALGIAHGAVRADHVLVAADGAVTLCGWGSALQGGDPGADVSGLAATLLTLAPPDERRLVRVLADAAAGGVDAAALAGKLAHPRMRPVLPRRPDAGTAPPPTFDADAGVARGNGAGVAREPDVGGVPSGSPSSARAGTSSRGHAVLRPGTWSRSGHRRIALIGAAACTLGLAVAVPLVAVPFVDRSAGDRCPAVDRGCRPVAAPGGVLVGPSGRVSVASPGEVVALGRWHCDGDALPAVLDPATGSVWVYDAWAAPGHDVAARLVATRPGSTTVAVRAGASCDDLVASGGVVFRGGRS